MGEHVRNIRVKAEIDTNKMTYSMVETVQTMADGEAAVKEFFDGYREEFLEEASLLDQAKKLLHCALLLRMHGDISDMPMTQKEWDSATESFLRKTEEME